MLDLDSPNWSSLADAYGSADGVPALLKKLEKQDAEALDELYGRICHQGSVYSASIVALPHLVQIAESIAAPKFRADILSLVGAIYGSPYFQQVSMSSETHASVDASIEVALALAEALLPEIEDTISNIYLLASLAAFAGFKGPVRVIEGFVNKEFYTNCPICEAELYIWPTPDGLATAAEDPVSNPATQRILVTPGPIIDSPQYAAYVWISQRITIVPSLSNVSARLPHLFGRAICPECEASFSLMDALVEVAGG